MDLQAVPEKVETPQTTASPVTTAKAKKAPRWLKIVGTVLIIVAIALVTLFFIVGQATKNASKVSDKLVADIQSNNETAAYVLTSPNFKQASSQADLTALMNRISPLLQGKAKVIGRSINKASGQPNQAIIVYSVATKAGTKYIRIVLQDNHPWQVYNFRSSDTLLSVSSTS